MQTREPSFNDLDELAGFLRLIGNPLRLEILFCLLQEPCCVCELAQKLNQRQPCISQHLMLLRKMGLVSTHKEGWNHLYFISSEKLKHCLVYMQTSWLSANKTLISTGIKNDD